MNLSTFFYKIKIGFKRIFQRSIPITTEAKRYGNAGENDAAALLKRYLPTCKIKKNVIIQTSEGNAEIDCLVLYQDKLFAIEIKRWKGDIIEVGDRFLQKKVDRWTDEIHEKYHKSPFKQVQRAIYLLRKQIPVRAWINAIVYFEDADSVVADSEQNWFCDIEQMVSYIIQSGQISQGESAIKFFQKCTAADLLYSDAWGKTLQCLICKDSISFSTPNGTIGQEDIREIFIKHHWSYDELEIHTMNGNVIRLKEENKKINVIDNGEKLTYAVCKLDWIRLGAAL